jgi:hypothetical protein
MTNTTQADLEREDVRNKTNGEFGAKTQTAPGADIATAAGVRIFTLRNELDLSHQARAAADTKHVRIAKDIMSAIIHNAGLEGEPHTLIVYDSSEDGSGWWSPESILDVDGEEIWTWEGDEGFDIDLEPSDYTTELGLQGSDHILLSSDSAEPYDETFGFVLTPPTNG